MLEKLSLDALSPQKEIIDSFRSTFATTEDFKKKLREVTLNEGVEAGSELLIRYRWLLWSLKSPKNILLRHNLLRPYYEIILNASLEEGSQKYLQEGG